MNYFPSLLKQVISSQDQQNKPWMMWLSAEMYRVWGGCRTRTRPPSSRPLAAWPNTSPPAVPHWTVLASLLNGCGKLVLCESTDWHHQRRNTIQVMTMREHNDCSDPTIVAWSFVGYQFMNPQRVLQLNAIGLYERETSVSYVFAGWQPKKAENKSDAGLEMLGTSNSDVLETRDYVLLTFVHICILKWMDPENPSSFQIVSVRSQNLANKTGNRVKQLQHVSNSQTFVVSSWAMKKGPLVVWVI